jgi:Replication-relaxation
MMRLLAWCPELPADVASQLTMTALVSSQQLLIRLRTKRLVGIKRRALSTLSGSRKVGLWSLTDEGLQKLKAELPGDSWLEQLSSPRRPSADAEASIASYWLLAATVAEVTRSGAQAELVGFEQPWKRSLRTWGERFTRAQLPAAALLNERQHDGQWITRRLLLLPEIGARPVGSYRRLIARVATIARMEPSPIPTVLTVGTTDPCESGERVDAWRDLLHGHDGLLSGRVLTWDQVSAIAPTIRCLKGFAGIAKSDSRTHVDLTFDLVSRHPLLDERQIAALVGVSTVQAKHLQEALVERGWARLLSAPSPSRAHLKEQPRVVSAVELTPRGLRVARRRLLLPVGFTGRTRGDVRAGTPARFIAQLAHTVGANSVFVAFAAAARLVRQSGGDDALEVWRSAAAAGRGGFRPDGYGCYRRAGTTYGFFLEYDRGTERAAEYASKLATYYRYHDRGSARTEFHGFPTLLFITTRPSAEERFAREAERLAARTPSAPLNVLLTTTALAGSHAEGILGDIWIGPDAWTAPTPPRRQYWLEGRLPRGLSARNGLQMDAPLREVTRRFLAG